MLGINRKLDLPQRIKVNSEHININKCDTKKMAVVDSNISAMVHIIFETIRKTFYSIFQKYFMCMLSLIHI